MFNQAYSILKTIKANPITDCIIIIVQNNLGSTDL
ncbi:hypothetical protein AERO8C_70301 [Aeromonas veronii]|uniref:Uncharacterized protein n=1 Tax=Aeromonas veronii TaxID=654 RepID=A0A653LAG1_AERVE|nr:hypothetical protein AERO8C_70301 [Aeromonas veronii]